MLIYHGNIQIVECSAILQNQRTLDFGQGFYTTSKYCKFIDAVKL